MQTAQVLIEGDSLEGQMSSNNLTERFRGHALGLHLERMLKGWDHNTKQGLKSTRHCRESTGRATAVKTALIPTDGDGRRQGEGRCWPTSPTQHINDIVMQACAPRANDLDSCCDSHS